jgi:transcriptional regulator with XRE-family HTH domain
MDLKPYSATELTRIYALNELIGATDKAEFASRHGLSFEGLSKYLSGKVPITKKIGRMLATRLDLPFDYFELAEPGTKNEYNSPESSVRLTLPTSVKNKSFQPRTLIYNNHLHYSEREKPEYYTSSPQEIGKRLQEDRIRLDFGITRFAGLMSVDVQTQTKYECGSVDIPAEYLRIAELSYKIDVQYVLSGKRQTILTAHQEDIGRRLKEVRLKMRMTEYEFSHALSGSLANHILYESGVESIPASYLSLASIRLNADVVYILTANKTYRGKI